MFSIVEIVCVSVDASPYVTVIVDVPKLFMVVLIDAIVDAAA